MNLTTEFVLRSPDDTGGSTHGNIERGFTATPYEEFFARATGANLDIMDPLDRTRAGRLVERLITTSVENLEEVLIILRHEREAHNYQIAREVIPLAQEYIASRDEGEMEISLLETETPLRFPATDTPSVLEQKQHEAYRDVYVLSFLLKGRSYAEAKEALTREGDNGRVAGKTIREREKQAIHRLLFATIGAILVNRKPEEMPSLTNQVALNFLFLAVKYGNLDRQDDAIRKFLGNAAEAVVWQFIMENRGSGEKEIVGSTPITDITLPEKVLDYARNRGFTIVGHLIPSQGSPGFMHGFNEDGIRALQASMDDARMQELGR